MYAVQTIQTIEGVDHDINRASESALFLYDLGFNVIALQYQNKYPYHKWKADRHSRLLRDDLSHVFEGLCNVGVIVGENIGILDVESRELGLDYLRRMYLKRIPILGWHTGRGLHIAFRVEGAKSVKTIPLQSAELTSKQFLIDAELRGWGKIAVSVGSVHASGAVYTLLTPDNTGLPETAFAFDTIPTIQADSLDFVRTNNGKPFIVPTGRFSARFSAYEYYLSNGANIPEGKRNNALYDASRDAKYRGLNEGETLERLTPLAVQSGLESAEAVATIKSGYKSQTAKTNRRDVETYRAQANSIDWTVFGRAKDSAYKIYQALIQRYELTPPDIAKYEGIRATPREISVMTGISAKTVFNVMRLLADKGLIKTTVDAYNGYTVFRFTNSPKGNTIQQVSTPTGLMLPFGEFIEGLTIAERKLLATLSASDTPMNARRIATASGLSYSSTSRLLGRFVELNLISETIEGKRKVYTLEALQGDTIRDAIQPRIVATYERQNRLKTGYTVHRAIHRAKAQIKARLARDTAYRELKGIANTPEARQKAIQDYEGLAVHRRDVDATAPNGLTTGETIASALVGTDTTKQPSSPLGLCESQSVPNGLTNTVATLPTKTTASAPVPSAVWTSPQIDATYHSELDATRQKAMRLLDAFGKGANTPESKATYKQLQSGYARSRQTGYGLNTFIRSIYDKAYYSRINIQAVNRA